MPNFGPKEPVESNEIFTLTSCSQDTPWRLCIIVSYQPDCASRGYADQEEYQSPFRHGRGRVDLFFAMRGDLEYVSCRYPLWCYILGIYILFRTCHHLTARIFRMSFCSIVNEVQESGCRLGKWIVRCTTTHSGMDLSNPYSCRSIAKNLSIPVSCAGDSFTGTCFYWTSKSLFATMDSLLWVPQYVQCAFLKAELDCGSFSSTSFHRIQLHLIRKRPNTQRACTTSAFASQGSDLKEVLHVVGEPMSHYWLRR